jgi:hypothetical protein
LPETMKTVDTAPRASRRSVNEVGVAIDSAVGKSAGDGEATASVGNRVGLGSVANCGPVSSSAHATSKKPATSAARYAGPLERERLISTSRKVERFHSIARAGDRQVGRQRRNSETTATCITKGSRRRKTDCRAVGRARDAASLQQTCRRLVQPAVCVTVHTRDLLRQAPC